MRHPISLAAGLLMAAPAFGQDGNAMNGRGFMIEAPKLGFSVEVPGTTEWLARSAFGADALEATITVETDGSLTPAMLGRTNLPDRTELAVTLRGLASWYLAQARSTVESGRFKTEPFSIAGQALLAGDYEVEVLMPLPMAQPESVRKVLGAKGENLKGPLIEKSWLGNLVRHSFTINIAGPVSAATMALSDPSPTQPDVKVEPPPAPAPAQAAAAPEPPPFATIVVARGMERNVYNVIKEAVGSRQPH